LAMVFASLPLAVIGNVVRLGSIVAAGEWKGQSAGNYVHESAFFSMLPYIPAFLGMIYIGHWLEKLGTESKPAAPASTTEAQTT